VTVTALVFADVDGPGSLSCPGCDGELSVQPGVVEIEHRPHAPAGDGGAALANELRARALELHGTLAWRNAPRSAIVGFDPFGAPAHGLDLMRRIQRKLDPAGVFATGRFHGGL